MRIEDIPKEIEGVRVVIRLAPDSDNRIASVLRDKDGKSYIVVRKPEYLTPLILQHELGHVKTEHRWNRMKWNSHKTLPVVRSATKMELAAEKYAFKKMGIRGMSGYTIADIIQQAFDAWTKMSTKRLILKNWELFKMDMIKYHHLWGVSREEMVEAMRVWERNNKRQAIFANALKEERIANKSMGYGERIPLPDLVDIFVKRADRTFPSSTYRARRIGWEKAFGHYTKEEGLFGFKRGELLKILRYLDGK